MAMTFDGVDAHDTGGVAEEAVRLLNIGLSAWSVARLTKSSPAVIGYLRVHPEYDVKTPERLAHEQLALQRVSVYKEQREFMRTQKKISRVLAAIRRQVKSGTT